MLVICVSSVAFALTHEYDFTQGANGFYTDASLTNHPSAGSANKFVANTSFYASDGAQFTVLAASKVYFSDATSGYLMVGNTQPILTLPTFKNEKITKITFYNTSGCSTSVKVTIKSGSNTASAQQQWSTQNKSGGYTYNINADYQSTTLKMDVTSANAQITKIVFTTESTGFSVTYDANGATSGSVPTDATAYTNGATVTVKGNTGNLAKTGYNFIGWNTNKTAATAQYVAGGTFTISANTTLYAIWSSVAYTDYITSCSTEDCQKTISITKVEPQNGSFKLNRSGEGVCIDEDQTVVIFDIQPATHYHLGAITPAATKNDDGTYTISGLSADIEVEVTFVQDPQYAVTWYRNGQPYGDPVLYYEGEDITAPAINPTTPTECTEKQFVGWTAEENYDSETDAPEYFKAHKMGTVAEKYYAVFALKADAPTWTKVTKEDELEDGCTYAIISYDDEYYLKNIDYFSANPTATAVTKQGDDIVFTDDMKWITIADGEGFNFKSNSVDGVYLWGGSANDGVRVSTTSAKADKTKLWKPLLNDTYGVRIYNNATTSNRYLSTNSTTDWRNYTSTTESNRAANLWKFAEIFTDYATICSSVPAPEFVNPSGSYCGSVNVKITVPENTKVRYTTDGTKPSKTSTEYTDAFDLTESGTVKAAAFDANDVASRVVVANYVIPTAYATMDALMSITNTEPQEACVTFDNWVVTKTTNEKAYFTTFDGTTGIVLSAGADHGFVAGKKYSGTALGSVQLVNGYPQLGDIVAADLTNNGDASVIVLEGTTIPDLAVSNHGTVVKLTNLTAVSAGILKDDNANQIYYNTLNTPSLTPNAKYNITGCILLTKKSGSTTEYNYQISPRSEDDVVWLDTKLDTPKGLSVSDITTTKATLSWSAVDHTSGYKLAYGTGDTPTEVELSVETLTYSLEKLAANAHYTWSVTAIGDQITYSNSDPANGSFNTLDPATTKHAITYNVEYGSVAQGAPAEVSEGYTFIYPAITMNECAGGYVFAGWTTNSEFAEGTIAPADLKAAGAESEPVDAPIALYAVYKKETTKALSFDDFVADESIKSAPFVIAAKVGESKYIALPNSGYNTQSSGSTIDGIEIDITNKTALQSNVITIAKATTAGYNLSYQVSDNKRYIVGKSSSTSLGYVTSAPATGWTLGTAACGSVRLLSVTTGRGLYANSTKFGHYSTSNVTDGQPTYFDLEIIGVPQSSTNYSLTPDCKPERALVMESDKGTEFRLVEGETQDAVTITLYAQENTGSGAPLQLEYRGASEAVSISGTSVTFTAIGNYTIYGKQDATPDYAATEASIALTVKKAMNTLHYDANGGENAPADQTDENGKSVTVASNVGMTNGILAFKEWNTQSNGNGTRYNVGASYTLNGSATLYAIWIDAVEVKIDENIQHGTITSDITYAKSGDKITLTITPDEGYVMVPGSLKVTKEGTETTVSVYNNTFDMPSCNVFVTAQFAKGVLCKQTSCTEVEVTGGVPEGADATFSNTYTTGDKAQITSGNSMTLTLIGYKGKIITGITLRVRNSSGSGEVATLVAKIGTDFDNAQEFATKTYSKTSTQYYYDALSLSESMIDRYVDKDENIYIKISASQSSFYCESFFIEFVDGYCRDMSNGYMGTHCYPFDIAAGDYTGAQFYEIAYRIGNTRIYFDQVDHVEAGVPYLVVPEDEENGSILEAIVTRYTESERPVVTDNDKCKGFVGSYTQELLTASTNLYIVYNNEFRQVGNNVYVGKNRAYIDLNYVRDDDPQAGNPKAPHRISLRNSDAGTPTGINNIREEFGNSNGGAMKVFHDGNIYFIRESKIYNAQGAELK